MGHGAIYWWRAQLICGGQGALGPIATYGPTDIIDRDLGKLDRWQTGRC